MAKKIGIGLSKSSLVLLETLQNRNYVDQIFLPSKTSIYIRHDSKNLTFASVSEILKAHWTKNTVIIFVGALGAITRLIAPLIVDKENDPALLVLDSNGTNVVPLLGGHFAGANNLAIQLSEDLGSQVIITSDSSIQGRLALDSFGHDWGWKRSGAKKHWSQLMHSYANGLKIRVLQTAGSDFWLKSNSANSLLESNLKTSQDISSIDFSIGPKLIGNCRWHPSTLWIGIGCERNSSISLLKRAVLETLEKFNFAEEAVAGFASIDIKKDEEALITFSHKKGLPIRFFSAEELKETLVPNPSKKVESEIGCPSVCEASAILAAGFNSKLCQQKTIFHAINSERGAVTIAIAESKIPYLPKKGELHLVGIGPGHNSYLTGDAKMALARTPIWMGYSKYLDLIERLRRNDQVRIDGELTLEKERCLHAVELASQGILVSLISSGDSGIYGMAGLALEYLLSKPKDERPRFSVHPGISAVQIAASRIGAPLMNDFCVISLSDKLTPWDMIEQRLIAAGTGDFVIAFYNPKSQDRTWQLKTAFDILRQYRSPDTPAVFARQVGREEEDIRVYTLDNFPFEEVDMLTIVLLGNTKSELTDQWLITPRGYLK